MINFMNFKNICLVMGIFFGLLSVYSEGLIFISSLFIVSSVIFVFDYKFGKKKEFEDIIKSKLEFYERNYDIIKKDYEEYKKEIDLVKSKVNMLSSFNRQL